MQSVNEELQTINAELTTRNEQLTTLNNDFQNLLDSTRIATVFLDRDLRITRFTPSITSLFYLRETDRGRPITDIASRLRYAGLLTDVAAVLQDERAVEREVRLADGDSTFLMRVQPYRTLEQTIEGVVVTFVDISTGKRAQLAAEDVTHPEFVAGASRGRADGGPANRQSCVDAADRGAPARRGDASAVAED